MWDQLFGTYARISGGQHNMIVFGVRDLPRRDGLKPSAMFMTPWLILKRRVMAILFAWRGAV